MTDRGIIFSAPMVGAMLDDRKTQTRRLGTSPLRRCVPGDRLWVRESFFIMSDDYGWEDYFDRQGTQPDRTVGYVADRSDGPMAPRGWEHPINAKREVHGMAGDDDSEAWTLIGNIPSIYMPRWASRLTLTIAEVRLEPLQAIIPDDAIAEGLIHKPGVIEPNWWMLPEPHHQGSFLSPVAAYRWLWNDLHVAEGERWDDNPEVVALTFTLARKNIDA